MLAFLHFPKFSYILHIADHLIPNLLERKENEIVCSVPPLLARLENLLPN